MVVTRFAPSPTGRLHLGHALAAGFAWQQAAKEGGTFLLRFEDIDPTRCRAEYEAGILEDLAWLGLVWAQPVRRQSEHLGWYAQALDRLEQMEVIYPCFCTRSEVQAEIARIGHAPHGPEGPLYPGTCRHLSREQRRERITEGIPYAMRLNVDAAVRMTGELHFFDRVAGKTRATPEELGDVVLARKETPASYHLCATLDDALQGVTLVTRGVDLFPATHIHRLLQALLGLPTPQYHHHRLLLDAQGKRFAKRDQSVTLRALRESGLAPADVWARVGDLEGGAAALS